MRSSIKGSIPQYLLLLLVIATVLTSCKRKPAEWDAKYLVPLMKGSLSMADIVSDSGIVEDSTQALWLVYQNPLYSFKPADLVTLRDTSLLRKVSLDSLKLDDRTLVYSMSLGRFAKEAGSPYDVLIPFFHGTRQPLAPIPPTSASPVDIDATTLFESATLKEGFIDISIENGFPIDITDVEFEVRNKTDDSLISRQTFTLIKAGETQFRTVDVSGKSVEGILVAEIKKISSPGSAPDSVLIDTSDAIVLTFTSRDMKVLEAKAIFPAQNLVDSRSNLEFFIPGAELTYAKIRSGNLRISVVNTIPDTLKFQFGVPGATDPSGTPVYFSAVLPPAASGSAVIEKVYPLEGYSLDLTGESGTEFNSLFNWMLARIDSTGNLIEISLEDSLEVYYGLEDIVPEYVRGYFGQDTVAIGPAFEAFNTFRKIQSGILDFEQVDLSFSVYNSIGVDATVRVDRLTGVNSRTGVNVDLTAPFVAAPEVITRAFDNPFIPGLKTWPLTKSNSNIEALIENLPDKIEYEGEVFVNPNGNTFNYQDFAYADGPLNFSIDMEVPLSIIAQNLVLIDTFEFDLSEQLTEERDIKSALLTLFAENGFPLDARLQLTFLDNGDSELFSLWASEPTVEAGIVNGSCIVDNPVSSTVTATVGEQNAALLKEAVKVKMKVTFDTQHTTACADHLKIYSFYDFAVKLIADLEFSLGL